MCFDLFGGGKPPVDNSAAIARQQEQERQARIAQGETAIDSAFSQFDNPFFDQYTQSFLDYYNPQADKQFGDAKQDLRYAYARRGTLNSTAASKKFGDLIGTYGDARDQIASNALASTNDLRSQINTTRNNLSVQNAASADPSAAASNAASAVGAVQTAPTYSPLANVFAGIIDSVASNQAGQQRALPAGYSQLFAPGATSSSSGRVVR